MHEKTFEDKLLEWKKFRESLENSENPFEKVYEYYNFVPRVSIQTDPWSRETWPDPWELIEENQYCDFSIILGICYSLFLTERFENSRFEIYILSDEKQGYYYVLRVDNLIIGLDKLDYQTVEPVEKINNLKIQAKHVITSIW